MINLPGPLIYALIGIVNTLLHFIVFYFSCLSMSQSLSNFLAFTIAVIFSYFANSYLTFRKKKNIYAFLKMYVLMGGVAYGSGVVGDSLNMYPMLTFLGYSLISYILGYLLSKYIIFK